MLGNLFSMVVHFLLNILLFIAAVASVVVIPFLISAIINFLLFTFKDNIHPKQRSVLPTQDTKSFFLKTLFLDFPRRFVYDLLTRDPDEFPYCGVCMVVGEQGAGKTITSSYILHRIKCLYPNCQIFSNTPLSFADKDITSPEELILNDNGKWGVVKFIDEIQNWFNSAESKNFPPEMLSEISQQRKQHSLIVCTSQRFDRVSKAIRQQTHYIIKPVTFLGCLTYVRCYRPNVNEDGAIVDLRKLRSFFFVQNDELRNCFDTYAKIRRLSLKGFKPRSEQLLDSEDFTIKNQRGA